MEVLGRWVSGLVGSRDGFSFFMATALETMAPRSLRLDGDFYMDYDYGLEQSISPLVLVLSHDHDTSYPTDFCFATCRTYY